MSCFQAAVVQPNPCTFQASASNANERKGYENDKKPLERTSFTAVTMLLWQAAPL